MKIYFHLFLVLVLISLNCVKLEAADEKRCPNGDPPTSQLEKQYWEEQPKYKEIISDGRLNDTRFSNLTVKIEVSSNKQECFSRMSNLTHDTICRYTFVYDNRTDRYPNQVKYAVCNSKNCTKGCKHKCLPVIILKPILMRTNKCSKQGVAIWEFRLEERPFQCYCGRIRNYTNINDLKRQVRHLDLSSRLLSAFFSLIS